MKRLALLNLLTMVVKSRVLKILQAIQWQYMDNKYTAYKIIA